MSELCGQYEEDHNTPVGEPYVAGKCHANMSPREKSSSGFKRLINEVTIIFVCYSRPKKASRLLRTIDGFFPGIRVVMADVSPEPIREEINLGSKKWRDEWAMLRLEGKDEGNLSAGRNAALEQVTTPYFLLIDDDHFFRTAEDTLRMFRFIRDRDTIDIVGGSYMNIGGDRSHWFGYLTAEKGDTLRYRRPVARSMSKPFAVDITHNYFVADTAVIQRAGGWSPDIAIVSEHVDFFLKMKMAGASVFFDPRAYIAHDPGSDQGGGDGYKRNRYRYQFRETLLRKWGFKKYFQNSGQSFQLSPTLGVARRRNQINGKVAVGVMTTARSGSSCIGQVLSILGVNMGENLSAPTGDMARVNPDGYFEDSSLIRIASRLFWGTHNKKKPCGKIMEELYDQLDDFFHFLSCRCSLWGFKNPTLSEHIPQINSMLKRRGIQRRWIWAHRDPEDSVRSFMEAGWGGGSRAFAEENILPRYRNLKKFFRQKDTKDCRFLKVDYYDLLDHTEREVKRIAMFVGVSDAQLIQKAVESVKPSASRSRVSSTPKPSLPPKRTLPPKRKL